MKATRQKPNQALPSELHDSHVLGGGEVKTSEEAILDVVEDVLVDGHGWPLLLQLEDDHAVVMTCRQPREHNVLKTSTIAPKHSQ